MFDHLSKTGGGSSAPLYDVMLIPKQASNTLSCCRAFNLFKFKMATLQYSLFSFVAHAPAKRLPCTFLHFEHVLFVLNKEQYIFHFANVWNSSAWTETTKKKASSLFFQLGTPPPFVYISRHWCHSLPFPFLHAVSDQKLDGGKAWEWG